MAKFADFEKYFEDKSGEAGQAVAGGILKTAMAGGALEDYGKAIVSAVMDSYVPGLSSMFSQGVDPMAQQTEILLDAIEDLENTMIRLEGDGWAEFRSANRNDIKTTLEAARDGIRNWLLIHSPNGGWSDSATTTLYTQIDRLTYLLNQIEVAVKTHGSAGELAPFPYLSLLEVYTEVVQLYLLTNPNYVMRAEANDRGIKSLADYQSASEEVLGAVDQMASDGTLAIMEATLDDAMRFAQQVSDLDPYRARAAWMVSERPVATWFEEIDCDGDTERVQGDAQWVLGLLLSELPYNDLPDVVYTYSSRSMESDYSTHEQHHCIVQDRLARGWFSTYDGFATMYPSVDEAFRAHQQGSYNVLLRVGWGPFAITLDKWWQTLRNHGLRNGLRPALSLDRDLAQYLMNTGGDGVTVDTAMYIISGSSDRQPTPAETALLIDFAVEHGPEDLMRLYTEAYYNDSVFYPDGGYRLDDRLRFVTNVRDPARITDYFKSLQSARILSIL